MTYRLECGCLAAATVGGHVVDGDASSLRVHISIDTTEVGPLRDHLVRAILGGFEVEAGGPVVAEVLGVRARRASGQDRRVVALGIHLKPSQHARRGVEHTVVREPYGDVEGAAADYLVSVRRRAHAGVDDGVDALDDELRAGEPQ